MRAATARSAGGCRTSARARMTTMPSSCVESAAAMVAQKPAAVAAMTENHRRCRQPGALDAVRLRRTKNPPRVAPQTARTNG